MRAAVIVVVAAVVACATTSSRPRRVIGELPTTDAMLGGCTMDALDDEAQQYQCGEITLEVFDGAPNSALAARAGKDAVVDGLDLVAGGTARSIDRARAITASVYEMRLLPRRTVRCVTRPGDAYLETQCLTTLAAFAGQAPPAGSSTPPPVPAPEGCVIVDDGRAQCGGAELTWRELAADADEDDAVQHACATLLRGAADVANDGPYTCAVAGVRARCEILAFFGGGIVHGAALVHGKRLLATCAYAGSPHAPPPECEWLVRIVQ